MFPMNIYLADDDLDDVEVFLTAINEITPKSEVTVSGDGEELLQNLEKSTKLPDVIFLDINMPRINGFDALKAIKSVEVFNTIPVVMYSTCSHDLHIITAHKLGAHLYIIKPSDYSEVRHKIEEVLSMDLKSVPAPQDFADFVLK